MENYDLLIDRIVKSSGLEREEIEKRVEDKKKKLSGLISREGAAQIIAAELGISFEDQLLKISEIRPGMKKVNVLGKIVQLYPVREFQKPDRSGKVANFIIADETGSLKIVLWDVNHISLIENNEIKSGDVIEIKNGSMRDFEVHLSSFSEFKKSSQIIENVREQSFERSNSIQNEEVFLEDLRNMQNVSVSGVIVQFFQPRFYSVCKECGKKAVSKDEGFFCAEHGKVETVDKAILNFVIDDGTDSARVVLFSGQLGDLISEEDLKDSAKFLKFRDDFLGSEVRVKGIVKRNQLFNNLEIIANNIEKINVEELIKSLEVNR